MDLWGPSPRLLPACVPCGTSAPFAASSLVQTGRLLQGGSSHAWLLGYSSTRLGDGASSQGMALQTEFLQSATRPIAFVACASCMPFSTSKLLAEASVSSVHSSQFGDGPGTLGQSSPLGN